MSAPVTRQAVTSRAVTQCAACRFFDRRGTEGFCRRHAPGASEHPFEVARWPETRATDACGEGEPRDEAPLPGSPADDKPACRACVFWHRPGIGIDPTQRGDHLRSWWYEAGYCRRWAPRPGVEIGHHAFWRVTHGDQHCAEHRRA